MKDKQSLMLHNQKGIATILIIAAVVVILGVIITIYLFNLKRPFSSTAQASPAPSGLHWAGCKDVDYTGCDGKEVFSWKDDGKR